MKTIEGLDLASQAGFYIGRRGCASMLRRILAGEFGATADEKFRRIDTLIASYEADAAAFDAKSNALLSDCAGCKETGIHPSHNGSRLCESGSIASGGTRAHCTCDVCF